MKKLFFKVIFVFFSLIFCLQGYAQDEQPPSRSITSLDFQKKRQPAQETSGDSTAEKSQRSKFSGKKIKLISSSKRRYNLTKRLSVKKTARRNSKQKPAKQTYKSEELGVTFWRMRPVASDDEEPLFFPVKIGKKTENWTAERVSSATEFQKNDRVRFTLESSISGYLYIVNREVRADGTNGAANIIFPTLRTRSGNNRVQAGSLIEIPAADDTVPYFTVNSLRNDYAGEELIVLILPDELPNFKVGLRAQPLSEDILEKWFEDWESIVDVYDAEDGSGIAYTSTEAQTANVPTRSLTQEEPLPQTIYKVTMRENLPVFVVVKMQVSQRK